MSSEAAATLHPLAPHHLPSFISDGTGGDPMMTNVAIFVAVMVFIITTFFLHLHSLPEKLAHKVGANQLQMVGVLALIALFTHNNLYWVAALLLALVQVPDYETPLQRIADALDRLKAAPQPIAEPVAEAPAAEIAPPAPAPTKDGET